MSGDKRTRLRIVAYTLVPAVTAVVLFGWRGYVWSVVAAFCADKVAAFCADKVAKILNRRARSR